MPKVKVEMDDELLLEYEKLRTIKPTVVKLIGKNIDGNSIVEFVYPSITVRVVGKLNKSESENDGVVSIDVKLTDLISFSARWTEDK